MQRLSVVKNVLVLAVVTSPLVVLMVKNLHQSLAETTSVGGPTKRDDTTEDLQKIVEATKSDEDQQKALEKLGKVELFGKGPPPPLTLPGVDQTFWTKLTKARDSVDRLAKIYHGKNSPDPETELNALRSLEKSEAWEGLAESEPLQEWITKRIETLRVQKESRDTLSKAQRALKKGEFEACLEKLKTIDDNDLDNEQKKQVKGYKRDASFWLHWKPKPESNDPVVRARDRKTQLDNSPELPPGDEPKKFMEKKKAEWSALDVENRLNDLFKSPPELPSELLATCHEFLQENENIGAKLGAKFRSWLVGQIVELKSPNKELKDAKIQEAWQKGKNVRLVGVFQDAGNGNNLWFKYWTIEDWQAKKTYTKELYPADLEGGKPKPPAETTAVVEFNKVREALLDTLDSKESWMAFRDKIAEQQAALDEHYRQINQESQPRISLRKALRIAKSVLEDWSGASEILANK